LVNANTSVLHSLDFLVRHMQYKRSLSPSEIREKAHMPQLYTHSKIGYQVLCSYSFNRTKQQTCLDRKRYTSSAPPRLVVLLEF